MASLCVSREWTLQPWVPGVGMVGCDVQQPGRAGRERWEATAPPHSVCGSARERAERHTELHTNCTPSSFGFTLLMQVPALRWPSFTKCGHLATGKSQVSSNFISHLSVSAKHIALF